MILDDFINYLVGMGYEINFSPNPVEFKVMVSVFKTDDPCFLRRFEIPYEDFTDESKIINRISEELNLNKE